MPIYEYFCEKCHHVFEEWARHIDDNVEQVCPDCASSAHRIVSNTSFVLKGSGWYVTDYGSRKGAGEGNTSAPASSAASTSSAAGGESAPAAAASTSSASSAGTSCPGASVSAA